jgi:alginate O-acetyltransferase complex protein AlgI
MVFSHPTFLFLFLPAVLALYALAPRGARNALLLVASLAFYAFDRPEITLVMLASIALNWALGLWVERAGARSGVVVALALAVNLGLLGFFKYWNFLWDNLQALWPQLERFPRDPVELPIGISFFTFQALSYVIDVRRGEARAQRSPLDFGLYIALFPQLIAGPIVRYRDVAEQIVEREHSLELFARGVRRFVVGLGKKMLIANVLAGPAKEIFEHNPQALDASTAWLGALCYTAQIYFDFSGYSDMAIGLGLMFGFRFLENFNYPYIARSVTEFWRRWHISLSSWFRDYLYIPLGGNRAGSARTYFNLLTVFLLCGLWHGAAWNFVVWGLYHGAFLVFERVTRRDSRGEASWFGLPVTLLVVVVGWVFFNAPSLSHALEFLRAMAGAGGGDGRALHAGLFLTPTVLLAGVAAVIGSTPWLRALTLWREQRAARNGADGVEATLEWSSLGAIAVVFVLSAMTLSGGTLNPFIYFRF